jgi:hypothetical protein
MAVFNAKRSLACYSRSARNFTAACTAACHERLRSGVEQFEDQSNRQLDPKGAREEPGRTHPGTTPEPPRNHPRARGPQGHKNFLLDADLYVFERRDGRRHPAHVGPRLGSPAPCTRGTRCSRTSPRQPDTQYGVSGRRGAAALTSL